jgi:hypothetical protein
MSQFYMLDDDQFWAWLCAKNNWEPDGFSWIRVNVKPFEGEDNSRYWARGWQAFRDAQNPDYKFYLELMHHITMAGDPYIHFTPGLPQQEIEKGQRAEQDLYGLGWALEDIAEVCKRRNDHTETHSYKSWAVAKLRSPGNV